MRSRILATALIATLSFPLFTAAQTRSQAQSSYIDDAAKRRAARRAAAEIFYDRTRPEKERLAALPRMRFPDKEMAARLLLIGADKNESDTIRLEALKKHPFTDKWLDLVLKILDDPNDGGEVLDSGLTEFINRRATFKLPAEIRQRIIATWRRLLDDPRPLVRLSAYRVLVANHDSVAVTRLSDRLRDGTNIPIPIDEAIDLLDLVGPLNHLNALRPYLTHGNPRVRARAARVLAGDSQSRAAIIQLANDREQPDEVRRFALRGLAREDHNYGTYAIELIENPRNDGDVRFGAMHSYAGRLNYNPSKPEEQIRFAQAVERVMNDPSIRSDNAQKIRTEAREMLEYLKMAFPAVKNFYANP